MDGSLVRKFTFCQLTILYHHHYYCYDFYFNQELYKCIFYFFQGDGEAVHLLSRLLPRTLLVINLATIFLSVFEDQLFSTSHHVLEKNTFFSSSPL